jgi:hypothetical protein
LNFDDQGNDRGAHHRRGRREAARHAEGRRRLSRRLDGLGQIGFSWPDAYLKCETSANIIKGLVDERGWKPDEINIEYLGYNALLGANADPAQRDS